MSDTLELLEPYRKRHDEGDALALFDAIKVCGENRIILPDWLVAQFGNAYGRVIRFEVDSLDKAFGRPIPKGKHLNALRKKRKLAWRVFSAVERQHGEGAALDEGTFASVGASLSIGSTLAKEYYYEFKAFVEVE